MAKSKRGPGAPRRYPKGYVRKQIVIVPEDTPRWEAARVAAEKLTGVRMPLGTWIVRAVNRAILAGVA